MPSRVVPTTDWTGERQIDAAELVRFADAPPDGLELGGSARTTFAIVELAHRGVAEGLVHPYLEHSNGAWHAFWGSTLDATVQKAFDLDRRCPAQLVPRPSTATGMPSSTTSIRCSSTRSRATASGVEPRAADRAPRRPPRNGRRAVPGRPRRGRAESAAPLGVRGAATSGVRLARRRSQSRWSGAVEARPAPRRAARAKPEEAHAIVLELWLQAEDDPTLGLPASLLWSGGHEVYSFLRAGDARRDLTRQLAEIAPLLADAGIDFHPTEPSEAELEPETVRRFLRASVPRLEEGGVPVTLPAAWLGTRSRLRVNLRATSGSAGPVERFPVDGRARAVRLAARGRRRRPHRRGAR